MTRSQSMMSVTGQVITSFYASLAVFTLLALVLIGDALTFLLLCLLLWLLHGVTHFLRFQVRHSANKAQFFTATLTTLFVIDLCLFVPLALLLAWLQSSRALLSAVPPVVSLAQWLLVAPPAAADGAKEIV